MPQKYRGLPKFESCPHTFASTEYNSLLQILSFGVISQKSEFFVKNMINKIFYFLKVNLYIYNLKLYLYVDFMKLLRCFCGKNLEHVKFGSILGFLVVVGGYLKKGCFIAFVVSCKNLIQTGFEHEQLKG